MKRIPGTLPVFLGERRYLDGEGHDTRAEHVDDAEVTEAGVAAQLLQGPSDAPGGYTGLSFRCGPWGEKRAIITLCKRRTDTINIMKTTLHSPLPTCARNLARGPDRSSCQRPPKLHCHHLMGERGRATNDTFVTLNCSPST